MRVLSFKKVFLKLKKQGGKKVKRTKVKLSFILLLVAIMCFCNTSFLYAKNVCAFGTGLPLINSIASDDSEIIKLNDGASISLQKENTMIRFIGRVDKATYDQYSDSIRVGIIIAPTNALKEASEFTIDGLSSNAVRVVSANGWLNENTAEQDGYYEFACAMKDMHFKEALTLSLSARAFIRLTSGENQEYVYSDFDLEKNSRTIQDVAKKLKDDIVNYIKYDQVQQTIIDAYALGELPRFAR